MSKVKGIRTGLLYGVGLAIVGGVAFGLLPDVANFLALWFVLSVPLGIAVGHCALNERSVQTSSTCSTPGSTLSACASRGVTL